MSFQSHFHSSQSVASSSIARSLLRPKSCQVMGGPHNPPFQFTWTWNMESTYKSSWCSEGKLKLLSCSGGMLQLPGCSLRELFQLLVCILTEKHTRGTTLYMPRLWPWQATIFHVDGSISKFIGSLQLYEYRSMIYFIYEDLYDFMDVLSSTYNYPRKLSWHNSRLPTRQNP